MKKGIRRFFGIAAAAGAMCGLVCAGVMPGVAFADEAQVQEGVKETYSIQTEAIEWVSKRVIGSDEFEKFGQVIADKSEAKAGDTVTIKALRGTEAGFWSRFYIEKISDGSDVTEELLGEKRMHELDESFIMPDYDIRIYAYTSEEWSSVPPPPVYDGEDYHIYLLKTEQTEGGRIYVDNADELVNLKEILPGNDFPEGSYGIRVSYSSYGEEHLIRMKAVPAPGYRFLKWYASEGVGITDDILKTTSYETGEDGVTVVYSTFDHPSNLNIKAIFVPTEPHNISIEKRYEDITAEIDKTSAKVGEKVHLKVDTSTSATERDLNCIIIKNASTGEEIKRIDGFLGHDHAWEGDIVMPDHDIVIEIASWKWAPLNVKLAHYLIQTEGGKISMNTDVGVEDVKMTLSYEADEGYGFVRWIVKDAEGNDITEKVNIKEDGTFDSLEAGEYYISAEFGKVSKSWAQLYPVEINVKFLDFDGKDLTKEVSYKVDSEKYEGEKASLLEASSFYPEGSKITHNYGVFLGGSSPDMIKSHLKFDSVPAGYKLPGEITLTSELYQDEIYKTKLTSSDESVSVIKAKDTEREYEVIVTLEKAEAVAGGTKSGANVTAKPSVVSSYASGAAPAVTGATAAPQTGESDNSPLWMAAGIAAAAAGAAGVVKIRRMKKED